MKVIVVGAGFTGLQLARSLADGGAEVVLVENDPEHARRAREQVDCAVVEDDGNSPGTLEDVGLAEADALVALTQDDEVNLITCALADAMFPEVRKIARVRNYAYYRRTVETARSGAAALRREGVRPVLGIDRMLNPDVEAASAMCRAADHGAVGNVIALDGDRGVLELSVTEGGAMAGVALRDLSARVGRRILVAWVEKPEGPMLPDGATTLMPGDRIGVVASPEELTDLASLAGSPPDEAPRRIVVFGAGLVGRFVVGRMLGTDVEGSADASGVPAAHSGARGLLALFGVGRRRMDVALVDSDPDLCEEAARMFPDARVLCGDVTEDGFLRDEGLDSADLAVLATPDHAGNLVMAAYLKSRGVRRTIALTAGASFDGIARKLGVDVAVPMRDTVVDAIAGHLRGRNVKSVHSVCNRRFEIVECGVRPGSAADGKSLRKLSMPGEYLLLLLRRPGSDAFEVPGGDTVLESGSRAVLVMRAGSRRVPALFDAPEAGAGGAASVGAH